jgi:hypothetical protein
MAQVLDDLDQARQLKLKRADLFNPLVGEIANALLQLGGAAHCDMVIDRIAITRGSNFASDGLRRDLMDAFDHHRATAAEQRRNAVLMLPFGDGSRRWGLSREAYDFLRVATRIGGQPQTPLRPASSVAPFELVRARAAVGAKRPRRTRAKPPTLKVV